MHKSLLIRSMIVGFVSLVILGGVAFPQTIHADSKDLTSDSCPAKFASDSQSGLLGKAFTYGTVKTMKMEVTAYTSREVETDDTPFINAAGEHVKDGDIAINGLPFGTKVRVNLPGFKDKIFTVKDRMNAKYGTLHRADVWMEDYSNAINFGIKYNVTIEVLES